MKSTKCHECGFVGWSDNGNCKACGAVLIQHANAAPSQPGQYGHYCPPNQPVEGQKQGLAIFALVLGIVSFLTFGLLGVGAIIGIIVAIKAMRRVSREPWVYGGRGMAIAGLVLNITALSSVVPMAVIAAIAIPNLLASRRAANEGSAIHSLRMVSEAEDAYMTHLHRFATLEELGAEGLIDPALASGTKHGYRFTLELTKNIDDEDGFDVYAVPLTYQSTGTRSFFVDESYIIRAGDNSGAPSTELDRPLESDSDRPTRRAAY